MVPAATEDVALPCRPSPPSLATSRTRHRLAQRRRQHCNHRAMRGNSTLNTTAIHATTNMGIQRKQHTVNAPRLTVLHCLSVLPFTPARESAQRTGSPFLSGRPKETIPYQRAGGGASCFTPGPRHRAAIAEDNAFTLKFHLPFFHFLLLLHLPNDSRKGKPPWNTTVTATWLTHIA